MADSLAEALSATLPIRSLPLPDRPTTAMALDLVLSKFKPAPIAPPRDLDSIAQRVLAAFRARSLESVAARDLRHASQAFFGRHQLAGDTAFVAGYLAEVTRRAKANVPEGLALPRLLFRVYLDNFSPDNEAIRILSVFLKSVRHFLSRGMQQRIEEGRLLDVVGGPLHLGKRLVAAQDLDRERALLGFDGALSSCRFVQSSVSAVGQQLSRSFRNGANIKTQWERYVRIVAPEGRILEVYAATAVVTFLDPFLTGAEPAGLREQVKPLLLASFRDPRIDASRWPRFAGDTGNQRRETYLSVVRRWLVSETIDLFFHIIDQHGLDHQWRTRKAFWKQFFDNDSVTEAWVVFANKPHKSARRVNKTGVEGASLEWGRIVNAGDPDHAVLLMQMRNVVVAEWSHNGRVRLWHGEGHPDRPSLYSKEYPTNALRRNPTFETAHLPPDGWQHKVERELRRYGIKPD